MKNSILKLLLLLAFQSIAQNPLNIYPLCNGLTEEDVPDNSYFKDVNHTYDNFIGTWIWHNGNEIVTFKLDKITQKFFPATKMYEDFMIGNYSYSIDGGNTFIINTIATPINNNPEANPMYNPCPEDITTKIVFTFRDVVLDKRFCHATFEFLPGSSNQMQVTIENPKGSRGRMEGQPPFNPDFTIPTSMIVTKQ